MRIGLHRYVTDPSLPQKDGVNLAHENIAQLVGSAEGRQFSARFHDFNRLLQDEAYARQMLSDCDWVVSNIGPHAHYYHLLRERLSLNYRILRDVRTALWSSYLLQEHLCQPLLRPGDVLMVATNYTRGIYERLFPQLREFQTLRCYPFAVAFPDQPPPRSSARSATGVITLGYIGRLSEDKNFPAVVELLVALNSQGRGNYRLLGCGDCHSASCHPRRIASQIQLALGDANCFTYLPARRNRQVWELYSQMDVLVFPSTSNLETLGRVLVEASYSGVPLLCAGHAAVPELVPPSSVAGVAYFNDTTFSTHFDHSLGNVGVAEMVGCLNAGPEQSCCHTDFLTHPAKFLRLLRGREESKIFNDDRLQLTAGQQAFIDAVKLRLPSFLDVPQAIELTSRLADWFVTLQRKGTRQRDSALKALHRSSRYPGRTQRYIEKTACTNCDFTDVGGLDIELCNIAGFYPEFQLTEQLE